MRRYLQEEIGGSMWRTIAWAAVAWILGSILIGSGIGLVVWAARKTDDPMDEAEAWEEKDKRR